MSLKFVLVTKKAVPEDDGNGCATRIRAWLKLLPEMQVLTLEQANALGSEEMANSLVCCDITGMSSTDIVKIWRSMRAYRPVAFAQDSQTRFYVTQLFAFVRSNRWKIIRPVINIIRGGAREILARYLFGQVGYISHIDARTLRRAGHVVPVTLVGVQSAEGIGIRQSNQPEVCIFGNFNYSPNRHGIEDLFATSEWRGENRLFQNKTAIIGFGADLVLQKLAENLVHSIDLSRSGPAIQIFEALEPFDIVVLPAGYGSGVKNKVIEVSQLGKLVFCWSGFRGEYGYDERFTIFFDTYRDLIRRLDMIILDAIEQPELSLATLKMRQDVIQFLMSSADARARPYKFSSVQWP